MKSCLGFSLKRHSWARSKNEDILGQNKIRRKRKQPVKPAVPSQSGRNMAGFEAETNSIFFSKSQPIWPRTGRISDQILIVPFSSKFFLSKLKRYAHPLFQQRYIYIFHTITLNTCNHIFISMKWKPSLEMDRNSSFFLKGKWE